MAKDLTFDLKGKAYSAAPEKVERKKLYGWVSARVTDENGDECSLAEAEASFYAMLGEQKLAA